MSIHTSIGSSNKIEIPKPITTLQKRVKFTELDGFTKMTIIDFAEQYFL